MFGEEFRAADKLLQNGSLQVSSSADCFHMQEPMQKYAIKVLIYGKFFNCFQHFVRDDWTRSDDMFYCPCVETLPEWPEWTFTGSDHFHPVKIKLEHKQIITSWHLCVVMLWWRTRRVSMEYLYNIFNDIIRLKHWNRHFHHNKSNNGDDVLEVASKTSKINNIKCIFSCTYIQIWANRQVLDTLLHKDPSMALTVSLLS